MTKVVRARLQGIIGSSDTNAVLDAGWQAMQAAHPNLAKAVVGMPPQVAQGVVMQYTNAIRLGKEGEAEQRATEAAKSLLASYKPTEQKHGFEGLIQRLTAPQNRTGTQINDTNAFDGFMSSQQQAAPQANTAQAFQGVKDKYNAYNDAQPQGYEKDLLWGKPQYDLKAPKYWIPDSNPSGPKPVDINGGPRNYNIDL